MELDELKKQLEQRITARQQHSVADISALLRKDTVSVVRNIKRSLWIELGFAVLFTLGCALAIVFSTQWIYRTYFSLFILIGIALIVVLSLLLKKANKLNNADTIKQNLQSLTAVLKEYVKRYMQLGMALLPLCFGLAYWLSYNDPTRVAKPFRWDVFGYLTAYLLALGTAMYYFTKWYLKKLYGNYINRLEEQLKEFEEV